MKSPIERQLHHALRESVPTKIRLDDYVGTPGMEIGKDLKIGSATTQDWSFDSFGETSNWLQSVGLYSNVRVLSYRADFIIEVDSNGGEGLVVIECDGHEWHERTKQQAAQDRARDRELFRFGIPTVRFTGSEIHHDAFACATEVWQLVAILWEKLQQPQFDFMNGFESGARRTLERLKDETSIVLLEEHW